jgi:hypothetical protein
MEKIVLKNDDKASNPIFNCYATKNFAGIPYLLITANSRKKI